jgi:hypothetical protein
MTLLTSTPFSAAPTMAMRTARSGCGGLGLWNLGGRVLL